MRRCRAVLDLIVAASAVCALCESDGRDKNDAAALYGFCSGVAAALVQAAAAAAAAAQAGCSQGGEQKGVDFALR